jgi:hypothetical protein
MENTWQVKLLIIRLLFTKIKEETLEEYDQRNLLLILVLVMHVQLILVMMGNILFLEIKEVNLCFMIGKHQRFTEQ